MNVTILNDYIQISRMNHPIGIWLLLFPGLTGLSTGLSPIPVNYWIIFFVGAVAMRSAGCIYNDMVDRPFDGKVSRTKLRPLVRKELPLSIRWAAIYLFINLAVGLTCLLFLNLSAILMGFITATMIVVYPWMKRITYWPQLFLGFTMNMGFVIGMCAVEAQLSLSVVLMYLGMVAWTLGYDTIYGFQDMEDDALIGVRSSSLKTQKYPKLFLSVCYGSSLLMWAGAGFLLLGGKLTLLLLGVIVGLLIWQVFTLKVDVPVNCLRRFKSNRWVAILLFLMLLAANNGY